uniref:Secreted protein n=1 Tax=Angiostrongylus cantonensis TaxID=6313 RepID=A0A0K0D3R6_ANGCA
MASASRSQIHSLNHPLVVCVTNNAILSLALSDRKHESVPDDETADEQTIIEQMHGRRRVWAVFAILRRIAASLCWQIGPTATSRSICRLINTRWSEVGRQWRQTGRKSFTV